MSQNLKIKGVNYNGVDSVKIPTQAGGTADFIIPQGTKNITVNGTHDVKGVASANVNVPIPDGYVKISDTENYTTQYAFGSYRPTADILMSSITIPIGFKPKIFVIRNHGGIKASASKSYVTTSFFVLDNNYNAFSQIVPAYSETSKLYSYATMNFTTTSSGGSQGSANKFIPTDSGVTGTGSSTLYFKGDNTYVYYAWG